MIPAILSCVFVLYLYRTLNAPDASVADASVPQPDGDADSIATRARMDELQTRLDQLAVHLEGDNQP